MKHFLIKINLIIALVVAGIYISTPAFASSGSFQVSPMYQNVSLVPGETYHGTFKVTNPSNNESAFLYRLYIQAFNAGVEDDVVFTNNGDYNQIVDWIELGWKEGVIEPNETAEIEFSIDVPLDAPAGGQYAAIMVRQEASGEIGGSVNLQQNYEISHLIYADVAGETVRKGEILDVSVPGFLFSGDISGAAQIKNTGNVHSRASSTLQIFPLFSKEEIYTNEEDPTTVFVMPDATRTSILTWDETPSIGIFHVIYNVEFEGVKSTVDKYVIICPLWLLFLILLAIILVIFKIVWGKKKEK